MELGWKNEFEIDKIFDKDLIQTIKKSKVAGFVDKSLEINMNLAFWDFYFSETNPQTKSIRIGLANPDL